MNENNPKQRKIRQIYNPQFKDQALERAEKLGVSQAAKDLGIAEPSFTRGAQRKIKAVHR
jgi:transposase